MDAAAVGEHDVALDHGREEQRADPRGGDLDPAQPPRALEVLGPHRPAQHDLGLGDPIVGLGPVARREETDGREGARQAVEQAGRQVPDRLGIADELEDGKGFHAAIVPQPPPGRERWRTASRPPAGAAGALARPCRRG